MRYALAGCARPAVAAKGPAVSGTSGGRLARVYLHGKWRILVVTNMADDETGAPGV
jgi:hypothetical protein